MLAHMRAANPGALRVPAVLIGKLPLQHQDLLAAPMGVALKMGAWSPADERDILRITALGVERAYTEPVDQTRMPAVLSARVFLQPRTVLSRILAQTHEQCAAAIRAW